MPSSSFRIKNLHRWDVSPREGRSIQEKLRTKIILKPLSSPPRFIAAVDVSCQKKGGILYAGATVFCFPEMSLAESLGAESKERFPYIPGLLSFREIPALLPLIKGLRHVPDIIMVDGQGIAHPRRLGIASHLGLLLGIPTLGCAKKILVGNHEDVGEQAGNYAWLREGKEIIGAAVRTRSFVKPVFVSPGHLMSLEDAVEITLQTTRGFRLPEPIRQAHLLSNRLRGCR